MINLNKEIFDWYYNSDENYYLRKYTYCSSNERKSLVSLVKKLFNEYDYKDLNMFNILQLEEIECNDERYGTKYYDNVLSYNGEYIYIQYSISDYDGLEIDDIKKVELKNIVKCGLNSCKYEFYDSDGEMVFFDYKNTVFDEEGNFIDCKPNIKVVCINEILDNLGIKLLNNIVVKYNENFSNIRNIHKLNLNSDYAKLFFAVITSYNDKVDFFKTYNKIKNYKSF